MFSQGSWERYHSCVLFVIVGSSLRCSTHVRVMQYMEFMNLSWLVYQLFRCPRVLGLTSKAFCGVFQGTEFLVFTFMSNFRDHSYIRELFICLLLFSNFILPFVIVKIWQYQTTLSWSQSLNFQSTFLCEINQISERLFLSNYSETKLRKSESE